MSRFRLITCLLTAYMYLGVCTDRASAEAEAAKAVPGGTEFALDLYRKIAADHEGENIFISPFSVRSALAMTWEGARGQTAEEMAGALRLPDIDQALVHAGFGSMTRALNAKDKPYEFNVANALWLEQTWPFEENYLKQIASAYDAGLNQADFVSQYEAARTAINGWVEEQTNEKIKELMPEGTVTQDTRLVLANAVYFKGQWKAKFDPDKTRDGDFTLIDGKVVRVPMMTREDTKIGFTSGEGFYARELQYVGGQLSMVILQPSRGHTLSELESGLTAETMDAAFNKFFEHEIETFRMPKFRITTESYRLNECLMAMGMRLAFADGGISDFTGMSSYGRKLHISHVLHKGFVDVNEEGTEAAAATGAGVALLSAQLPLVIDRPFLLLIRHRSTGEILFLGRVLDPREP